MDTYEKKYKEALEKARQLCAYPTSKPFISDLQDLFPELTESNDERIRKELIDAILGLWDNDALPMPLSVKRKDEWIAWLEKQGKETSEKEFTFKALPRLLEMIEVSDRAKAYTEKLAVALDNEGYHTDAKIVRESIKIMNGEEVPMATMDEQKPVDNIEPKFKVGDWITNGDYTWKIVEVKPLDYILQAQDGNIVDDTISYVDEQFHSFTVKDAKDGDVLASKDGQSILIFRNLDTSTSFSSYYNIQEKGELGWSNECFIPATKEQHDLLFSKMNEAGYEWDAETHELKKIKKNTDVVHEYFSELLENNNSKDINDYAYQVAYCMSHDWMKESPTWDDVEEACKIGAKWNERHHKSAEWSEEEEVKINRIVACLENLNVADNDILLKDVDWLKSLKERYFWKPKTWEIQILESVIEKGENPKNYSVTLHSILEQLKKLKGE